MNPFSLICLGVAGLIHLTLGCRLLWLSRRTQGAPEFFWGLTWLLAALSNFSDALSGAMPTPELRLLLRWGYVIFFPLVVMALFFANWRLFRPEALWAKILAILIVVICSGTWFYQIMGPGIDVHIAGTTRSLLNWTCNLGLTSGLAWAAYEAWRYHRMFEKRRRLGLARPLLPFRYLLWFGSAAAMVTFFCVMWAYQAFDLPYLVLDISLPTLSLISVTLMWLTFFPTRSLIRRLEQGEAPR